MTPRNLTIEEVKEQLPPVDVRYQGKIMQAMVRGRLNRFASVSLWPSHDVSFEYSWEAVHRAVITGNPLRT